MKRVFLDKCLHVEAKCREKPGTWNSGSNQRHLWLADRKNCALSTQSNPQLQKQMVHWWILGASLSNQHRKPQRMLIMDIRRNPVWRWSTLQHFQVSVLGRVNAAQRRHRRDRTWTRTAAKRGHHRFFFGQRKRGGGGGFVRTLRTPLGYVPGLLIFLICHFISWLKLW